MESRRYARARDACLCRGAGEVVGQDRRPGARQRTCAEGKGYVINVASYKNGVGYGKWTHIDGWSELVIEYVSELERA